MLPDKSTLLSRERGTLPDKFWFQMNGQSAQENYMEQKAQIYENLTETDDEEIFITSEVKIK